MKYQAYEKYKDSGVPWLGDVPEEWEVRKFSNFYQSRMGQTILASDVAEFGKIPVLSATEDNIIFGYLEKANVILEINDLVIPARGNSIGHVKLVSFKCTSTQTTISCKQVVPINPIFVKYYLIGLRDILFYFDRTAIPQITVQQVNTNLLLVPAIDEQKAIAAFLDEKTAEIDGLIGKKEALLKALAEKRTAVITHAVTKGLNPTAKLKPSGVPWLGDIPEGWDVKKLSYLATINAGYAFSSEDFQDDGTQVIRISDIDREGNVDLSSAKFLPNEYATSLKRYLVYRGDIVMAMTGATIGKVGIYQNDQPSLLNQRVCNFVPKTDLNARYLWLLLNSDFYKEHIFLTASGGAQPNISDRQLLACNVPCPSSEEQKAIATFLDEKTAEIDGTIQIVKDAISKLKEYRTSLITNAVTGKIDVRHFIEAGQIA